MQRFKKISSLFFLGIFSIFMLHQILPHVHHQHDSFEISIGQSGHHHHHSQEHNHDDGEEEDHNNSFLGLLLESHAHNYHSNDFHKLRIIAKQHIKVKDFAINALPEPTIFSKDDYGECKQTSAHHHQDFNNNPYLSAFPLRGPPVLG